MKKQARKHTQHIHPRAIHKHIARHFHKHAHKIRHIHQHVHHFLAHCGELLFVLFIGLGGIMFANFTWSIEGLERNNMTEVGTYLLKAINNPQNILKQGNLISVRKMDGNVENTFAKWYCTYGAARISPEFFPFIDEVTQQRTRWGNAVNRCENAAATWYKIWNTPVQWALIIYDAGGRFGPYGHVGKVMHYDRGIKKIIVRDMAWVAKFTMSDRREDLTTANVKCYIYNSKTTIPTPTTWTVTTTWTTTTWTTATWTITTWTTTTTWSTNGGMGWQWTTNPPSTGGQVTNPSSTGTSTTPPTTPTTPPSTDTATSKSITLDFSEAGDLVQHLISQRDIKAELVGKANMNIWDESVLTISITDKKTGEKISEILPLAFELVNSRNNIALDYASLKLINDGKIIIHIRAKEQGNASVVINRGEDKIGKIWFVVK